MRTNVEFRDVTGSYILSNGNLPSRFINDPAKLILVKILSPNTT